MNGAETRAEQIDPALKAAGWGVAEGTRILREHHLTPGRIEGLGRHGNPAKAHSSVQVAALPWGAAVEIEIVACA